MMYAVVKLQVKKVVGKNVTMIEVEAEVIDAIGGGTYDATTRMIELEAKDINSNDYVYVIAPVLD